jgi:hypothetical protein
MSCNEARERLVALADGELDATEAAVCREHVARCAACARELASHRRTWELLGSIESDGVVVGRERLERMADAALAPAGTDAAERAPPLRALSSRWSRVAAAAGLLLAVALGARVLLRGDGVRGGAGGGSNSNPGGSSSPNANELPACLNDPEFVKNFDVIRDLPDLDADGELFDVDDDDFTLLQALEGA